MSFSFDCSGVSFASIAVSAMMLPCIDRTPTDVTSMLHVPAATDVPDSRNGLSTAFLATVSDSPVMAASSVLNELPEMNTPSATILSPVSRCTTSPTTTSATGTGTSSPPRITRMRTMDWESSRRDRNCSSFL